MRFLIFTIIIFSCTPGPENALPEAEYEKLGKQIEYALKADKLPFIRQKFNQQYIYSNTVRLVDSLDLDKEKFEMGSSVKKQMISNEFDEFVEYLQKRAATGGTIKFIRPIHEGGHKLLFGIDYGETLDFLEFAVETQGDKTYIIDYFLYFKGLRYSTYFSWREMNRLFYGNDNGPFIEAWDMLSNATLYNEQGLTARAWQAYHQIPEEFSYHPVFHGTKEEIAANMPDSVFEETLYEKIGIHWDEKRTRYMNLAYYYRIYNMPDTALIYLDSLQSFTGGNFIMDTLRLQAKNVKR